MKKLEGLFDILGEILAVVIVVTFVVLLANAQWGFLASVPWLHNILEIIQNFGMLALVAIVGLEAMSKRNFLFRIIFYALLAIIVIFLFFPDTYAYLLTFVA